MIKKAKVFKNGRSQAVRLPKDFRFDCDEVYIYRKGDKIILTKRIDTLDEFFSQESAFGKDFLNDRQKELPQEREVSF